MHIFFSGCNIGRCMQSTMAVKQHIWRWLLFSLQPWLLPRWLCLFSGSKDAVEYTMWIACQKDSSFGTVVVKTSSFSGKNWESWHTLKSLHLAKQLSLCGEQWATAFGQVESSFYVGRKNNLYFIFYVCILMLWSVFSRLKLLRKRLWVFKQLSNNGLGRRIKSLPLPSWSNDTEGLLRESKVPIHQVTCAHA